MRNFHHHIILLLLLMVAVGSNAQPSRSRVNSNGGGNGGNAAANNARQASDRAALSFPVADAMPEEVVWRRDIYRTLDLTLDKNAPLYYPVEPRGKEQNLFTYLFRLVVSGRVPAYQYKLDGNESFEEADKIVLKEFLERYSIYYEENNGKVTVAPADIPSAEVKRFYIKESNYFDQRSATYRTRVTAFCPVMMNEFDAEATPYPLFWIKYDDVAGYLSRLPLMASNLNNVTNMTADDYFTLNLYEGKIYKTNNLQGRVLANDFRTDSALVKEQKRIEKELEAFEQGIWTAPQDSTQAAAAADSTQQVAATKESKPAAVKKPKEKTSSRRSSSSAAASQKRQRSSGGAAPRASARRQRR